MAAVPYVLCLFRVTPKYARSGQLGLVDTQALLTELLIEQSRHGEAQQILSETVAVLSADVRELETAIANISTPAAAAALPKSQPKPKVRGLTAAVLFKIWRRSFYFVTLLWIVVLAAGLWWLLDKKGLSIGDAFSWLLQI